MLGVRLGEANRDSADRGSVTSRIEARVNEVFTESRDCGYLGR